MLQICGVIELIRSEEVTPPPLQLLIFLSSTILAEREIMIDITHTSGTIRLTMTFYYPPTRASLWLLSSSPVPFNQHMLSRKGSKSNDLQPLLICKTPYCSLKKTLREAPTE